LCNNRPQAGARALKRHNILMCMARTNPSGAMGGKDEKEKPGPVTMSKRTPEGIVAKACVKDRPTKGDKTSRI